jgi:hypothetical protein
LRQTSTIASRAFSTTSSLAAAEVKKLGVIGAGQMVSQHCTRIQMICTGLQWSEIVLNGIGSGNRSCGRPESSSASAID